MGKSGIKNVLESPKDEIPKQLLEKKESKQENAPSFIKQVEKKVATRTVSSLLVLRYIPKSRRKDG